jgi:hypothetical protein
MEGCGPIEDAALYSALLVSFVLLAPGAAIFPEAWLQLETKRPSQGTGRRAKDANRIIGVALSTIGLRALDRSRQVVCQALRPAQSPVAEFTGQRRDATACWQF